MPQKVGLKYMMLSAFQLLLTCTFHFRDNFFKVALLIHNGRWKPDPSRISNKNYSTSPRGVTGVQRSEIKCRIQIHRFRAQLLTYLCVRNINVHFLCTFPPFLPIFDHFYGFFANYNNLSGRSNKKPM